MPKPSLTMSKRIKAPPAAVFQALTDPAKVAIWFGQGAPDSKDIQIDAKVGGAYHFGFIGQSGERNDVLGVYREVTPVSRLVFSWHWKSTPERESLVTVDIAPDGDGAMLTILHEQFFDQAACDAHTMGWTYGLAQLQALVEENAEAAA